jgi:predicted RNase H-like nuclease (RuvC/YqgF family)
MASYDSGVSKIESELKWQQDEAVLQQKNERNARESLARELDRTQSSWDSDIRAAISRQDGCSKKIESYERELASARRSEKSDTSRISHIESEMKWQRDELVIQQRNERNARESLKRDLERIQASWDRDIRVAIAKQDDCHKKIESLGRDLTTARNQAILAKAAEDKKASEAAALAATRNTANDNNAPSFKKAA